MGPPPNPLQPPPQGWQPPPPQQQPMAPTPPPHKSNNTIKWLLGVVAVLLVIAISVGATLLFTRDSGGGGGATSTPASGTTPTTPASDIASAGDTGPVAVIISEPTCQAFLSINNSLASIQKNGWADQHSTLAPVDNWTTEQRAQVDAVVKALRNATDQAVALAKETPHRVVREIYEQFIAYGRAYADSVPTYVPTDDALVATNLSASASLISICNAIENGAVGRSLGTEPAADPTQRANLGNPSDPKRFISAFDSTCTSFQKLQADFDSQTTAWRQLDPGIAATQWTPEQRATHSAARQSMTTWATDMDDAGRQSGNAMLEDFATTASLYLRAYDAAGDSYTSADSWLSSTAFRLNNLISGACRAAAA